MCTVNAGLVWQGCDAVKRAPMDNKSSLFTHLADVYVVIKDTLREVRNAWSADRRTMLQLSQPPGSCQVTILLLGQRRVGRSHVHAAHILHGDTAGS